MERPYGVLGRKLGHSYTPAIYRALAGLRYERFEVEPEDLESFIRGDAWEGVNVTIPYKRAVIPYLDELSDIAAKLGNVNTITRLPDGRLRGDNTDYFGFSTLVDRTGIDVSGKTVLVLADRAEPAPRRCRCCATEVRARWPWGVAVWSPTTIWAPMLTRRSS